MEEMAHGAVALGVQQRRRPDLPALRLRRENFGHVRRVRGRHRVERRKIPFIAPMPEPQPRNLRRIGLDHTLIYNGICHLALLYLVGSFIPRIQYRRTPRPRSPAPLAPTNTSSLTPHPSSLI